jgi:hypothetical protein
MKNILPERPYIEVFDYGHGGFIVLSDTLSRPGPFMIKLVAHHDAVNWVLLF